MRIEPAPSAASAAGQPRRHRGRRPAAGPAWRAFQVPRVTRHAPRDRFGERPQPQLGHLGLADHDRPRRPQPADDLGVGRRRGRVRPRPTAGDLAGDVDLVLDCDRDTRQRQNIAPGHASIGFVGLLERPLGIHGGEGIELGVDPLDPAQRQRDSSRAETAPLAPARSGRPRPRTPHRHPPPADPRRRRPPRPERADAASPEPVTCDQSRTRALAPVAASRRAGACSEAKPPLGVKRGGTLLVPRNLGTLTAQFSATRDDCSRPIAAVGAAASGSRQSLLTIAFAVRPRRGGAVLWAGRTRRWTRTLTSPLPRLRSPAAGPAGDRIPGERSCRTGVSRRSSWRRGRSAS